MDIENIDSFFPDNEDDLKKLFQSMGFDLDELEKEFETYAPKQPLNYEVINVDAVEPKYAYESDSGFDLHSTVDITIEPFGRTLVPTGLKFDIPDRFEIQIRPKSGLAIKKGLTVLNTPGTVDSGYDGEIQVILFNTNQTEIKINKGDKIAQAVLCPVVSGKWIDLVKVNSINNKERGNNGFGSTGM